MKHVFHFPLQLSSKYSSLQYTFNGVVFVRNARYCRLVLVKASMYRQILVKLGSIPD
jgi:hypothetical protein